MLHPNEIKRLKRLRDGVVRIGIVTGGAFAACAERPELLNVDVLLIFDAVNELRMRVRGDSRVRTFAFPLGARHTSRTLARQATKAVRVALNRCGRMDASTGCGQIREIGGLAMDDVIQSPKFDQFLSELIAVIVTIAGGALNKVVLVSLRGASGGTGSKAGQVVAAAIGEAIVQATDSVVINDDFLLHSLTSIGLGPRVLTNSAAATVESVAQLISPALNDRIVPQLSLLEITPVLRDRQLRDSLVSQALEARNCQDVEAFCATVASNEAGNGPLSNAALLKADFFRQLDPQLIVRPAVARAWAAELVSAEQAANAHQQHLKLSTKEEITPFQRPSIAAILESAQDEPDQDDIIDQIVMPGADLRCAVEAILSTGAKLDATNASSTFAQSPNDLAETYQRFCIQRAIDRVAREKLAELDEQRYTLDDEVQRTMSLAKRLLRAVQGRGWTHLLMGSFSSDASTHQRLFDSARRLRAVSDDLRLVEARIAALEYAVARVAEQEEVLVDWVGATVAALNRVAGEYPCDEAHPLIQPCAVDDRWQEVWLLQNLPLAEQQKIVDSGVKEVTELGLARIVSATPSRLEIAAHKIVEGDFVHRGPPYGGAPRSDRGVVVHVLPPMPLHARAQLKEMIKRLDPASDVAFAENGAGRCHIGSPNLSPRFGRRRAVSGNAAARVGQVAFRAQPAPVSERSGRFDRRHWNQPQRRIDVRSDS